MSISEHFRYRNDVFQSDIFVSDIGITDVAVGCRISPTLRSMSMPTYDRYTLPFFFTAKIVTFGALMFFQRFSNSGGTLTSYFS